LTLYTLMPASIEHLTPFSGYVTRR
jgi:hypothetical protein